MALLIAYLLAVAIFVGGGYGTLYWLVQPEPGHLPSAQATVSPPDRSRAPAGPRDEPAAAIAARTPVEMRTPASLPPSGPAATNGDRIARTGVGAASHGAEAAATERPAPGQNEGEHDDGAAARSAVVAAAPAATDGAAAETTTEAAAVETAGPSRSAAAAGNKSPGAKSRKRKADRAQRERGGGYRVMVLRTVELPDGSRRSFLLPPRRGFAFSGNVDDDDD